MGGNGVLPGKRDLTMNKTKMAWASAALALALLLPAAGVKAYSSENVSLPSPIVEIGRASGRERVSGIV